VFPLRECGVKNQLLSQNQLKQRFPWLNTDDIELGCLGLENEGWYDFIINGAYNYLNGQMVRE